MIAEACAAIEAAYVVFAIEASDYLVGNFMEVDGIRLYDGMLPSGRRERIEELWISKEMGATIPEGVLFQPLGSIGFGYEAYRQIDDRIE